MLSPKQFVEGFVRIMEPQQDPSIAAGMSKYMKNQFSFLGIQSVKRRKLMQHYISEQIYPTEMWQSITDLLWELDAREYQYTAIDWMIQYRTLMAPDDIHSFIQWVQRKSWWDTVDGLATQLVGQYMYTFRHIGVESMADQWILSQNMWVVRTALLYQLKFKEETDQKRLFLYGDACLNSEEFFIQKALGWALREFAKTDPEAVRLYVMSRKLPALTRREAMKHLS